MTTPQRSVILVQGRDGRTLWKDAQSVNRTGDQNDIFRRRLSNAGRTRA